jgi:tetratricopeptide (TPR) repeat protein
MGPAVMATEGYAAARSQRVFERACELIDEACPTPEKLRIICGLWNLRFHRGELVAALPLCENFLSLAKAAGIGSDLGHCLMGQNLCALGEFEKARAHLREVMDNYRAGTRSPQIPFGVDEPVLASTYMARVLWALGYPEQAFAAAEEAMVAARNNGNSVSMAVALIARLLLITHNPQLRHLDEVIGQASAFAAEHGLALFQNWIAFFEAAIRSRRGEAAEALPLMQRAVAAAEHRLSRQFRPFQLGCIAEAHLQLGEPDKALTTIDAAILVGESTGERQSEASLHRLRAETLHALGRHTEADDAFEAALAIARRQTARMEELRVALAMLRLAGEAERDRARSVLMQAYAKFGEGFALPDLVAARAELDALGGGLADRPDAGSA